MSTLEILSSTAALDSLLISELKNFGSEPAAVHAGHYALVRNPNGTAEDCLDESRFSDTNMGFADFSRSTWQAACRAFAAIHPVNAHLMILVNDWQFLTSQGKSRRSSERAAAEMREGYYNATPTLPAFHLEELSTHGLTTDAIIRYRDDCWLFSESTLRHELSAAIRHALADKERAAAAGIRQYFNDDGEPIVDVEDEDSGNFCLLYCGNTNCAGEVISLIENLHRRGIRRFLNIYPSQCREPVQAGTRIAYRLFDLDGFQITNIAVSGTTSNESTGQAVVERFGPDFV